MTSISVDVLHDIAGRVARRVALSEQSVSVIPGRCTILALSGDGRGLAAELNRLVEHAEPVVAVCDCPADAAGALALASARVKGLRVVDVESNAAVDRLLSSAERVVAPSMDLSLAARVGQLQSDSAVARVILRALLRGIPVSVSLNEADFSISDRAPEGARNALAGVIARLRSLGVHLEPGTASPRVVSAPFDSHAHAGAGQHPSQDRFSVPGVLNEFVEFLENRPCSLETGKPCVDCGACESRGF